MTYLSHASSSALLFAKFSYAARSTVPVSTFQYGSRPSAIMLRTSSDRTSPMVLPLHSDPRDASCSGVPSADVTIAYCDTALLIGSLTTIINLGPWGKTSLSRGIMRW